MIKPQKLNPGDRVAAISLSWGGPGTFPARYQAGKRQLEEEFGVTVVETRHALREASWLQRNPRARADDLMEAFADSSIKAVLATIGGDDSIRTLPYVDLDVLRSHPKIFLGFSDTTITHIACLNAGLTSFYGPAVMTSFAENRGMFRYVVDAVRRALFSSEPIGRIEPATEGWTVEYLEWTQPENQQRQRARQPSTGWRFLQGAGCHRGRLVGGCLDSLERLRGTAVWPAPDVWRGALLFWETSEEAPPPSAVRDELRTYAAMGILHQLSGILFGRPGGNVPPERFEEYDRVFTQVLAEEENLADLPVVTRMDFGHTDPVLVLPYSVEAEVDCDRREITILEAGVVD